MSGRNSRASVALTGPLGGLGNRVMSLFGVHTGATAEQRLLEEKAKQPEIKGIALPILLWMGARLPFSAFVSIVCTFTYAYHLSPITPWLLVFLSFIFAFIVCWPPHRIGSKPRGLFDWGPMLSWLVAIGFAMACGLVNYSIIESWINIAFLQEYTDIQQDTPSSAVTDAGVLTFSKGTFLDTSMSAGYKFWFYNYCAAPVVDANAAVKPITFWAVGVGCCSNRGEFTCDSAADKSTRSAMPLRPATIGEEITGHYNKAVAMAAAQYDLEPAKEVVFVRWHKDPKSIGSFSWWIATFLFLLFIVCSLCACCACQSAFTHINVMQQ